MMSRSAGVAVLCLKKHVSAEERKCKSLPVARDNSRQRTGKHDETILRTRRVLIVLDDFPISRMMRAVRLIQQ
jgi:hypothetical protein